MKTNRAAASWAMALLASLATVRVSHSLKIDIGGNQQECVTEHAERVADTFTGSFMLVEEDAYLRRWDGSFDLTVRDEDRTVVYSARSVSEHRFEFKAEREGTHEFCFKNTKHYSQMLYYHAHVGHHWAHDAATAENIDELAKSLASLKEIAGQVDEEVRYQKARDRAQRTTSETMNGRVLGYSVLEAAALVLTALFQANYVKRLFESKTVGRASGV